MLHQYDFSNYKWAYSTGRTPWCIWSDCLSHWKLEYVNSIQYKAPEQVHVFCVLQWQETVLLKQRYRLLKLYTWQFVAACTNAAKISLHNGKFLNMYRKWNNFDSQYEIITKFIKSINFSLKTSVPEVTSFKTYSA